MKKAITFLMLLSVLNLDAQSFYDLNTIQTIENHLCRKQLGSTPGRSICHNRRLYYGAKRYCQWSGIR